MRKAIVMTSVATIGLAGAANMSISSLPAEEFTSRHVRRHDFASYSAARPAAQIRLLFIHHSVGGTLLAANGAIKEDGGTEIYRSHPNGGNLRALLESQGYEVHEASRGSVAGDKTNLFDWMPKFRQEMPRLLRLEHNDRASGDGRRNQVVVFKSCFPNSAFTEEGAEPGNPAGPDLTLSNARATLTALLDEFRKYPDVLFVYLTAPPLAPVEFPEPAWKLVAKKVLGKPNHAQEFAAHAALARRFNNWVTGTDGWLKDYELENVVAFDFYNILTDNGKSNLLRFPTYTEAGIDSHPSAAGNVRAAAQFVPFLNRAARRAGISK